jgi:hypothetical protein
MFVIGILNISTIRFIIMELSLLRKKENFRIKTKWNKKENAINFITYLINS